MSNDEYTAEEEAIAAYCSLVVGVVSSVIAIFHASKMYSDFFTAERTELDFRRAKPSINAGYKRVAYLTLLVVSSTAMSQLIGAIQYNFTVGHCKQFIVVQIFDKLFFYVAKCSLYLVFIIRLHEVYGRSAYGYNENVLKCIAITVIIYGICLFIYQQAFTFTSPVYHDDTDSAFPFFCQTGFEEKYMTILGILLLLFDLVASVTAVTFFIIPLNKVVKACSADDGGNEKVEKRYAKMLYSGYKYKVLVFVAAISTLTYMLLFIVGFQGVGLIFAYLDGIINPLCVILMTPYYPSDIYYERLCCFCICCCDPKRKSYQSHSSYPHEFEAPIASEKDIDSTARVGLSVDTDMAMKSEFDLSPNNNNNTAVNLATVVENNTQEKDITPASPGDDAINANADANDTNL